MLHAQTRHIATLYIAVIMAVIGLWLLVITGHERLYGVLMGEGLFIEATSFLLWFLCALVAGIGACRLASRTWLYIAGITFLFGLRELDFDKQFTTMGILKTKFYFSATVPLSEKIIGASMVLFLVFLFIVLIRRFLRAVRDNQYRMTWVTGIALSAFVMLAAAKTLDGMTRKLADFGIETTVLARQLALAAEEVLELGAPLMVLLGLYAHYSAHRQSRSGS